MNDKGDHRNVEWTAEDRARDRAIREKFKDWHPTLEELLATGEYEGPIRQGAYRAFRLAMHALKTERGRQGLTLADVAERSGLDAALLSRLENGKQPNPTVYTILRYADALGKQLVWVFEDLPPTKPKGDGLPKKAARKRKRMS
jgi:hypothetical protein